MNFGRDELRQVSFSDTAEQAHLFGAVSSAVSRKVSHNDSWIAAAALDADDTLVTMDQQLADQLREAVQATNHLSEWLRRHHRELEVRHFSRS